MCLPRSTVARAFWRAPMFKPSNPQRSLLECEYLVSADKAERLKQTWAEPFRRRILPLIDEEVFRDAFSETTGLTLIHIFASATTPLDWGEMA